MFHSVPPAITTKRVSDAIKDSLYVAALPHRHKQRFEIAFTEAFAAFAVVQHSIDFPQLQRSRVVFVFTQIANFVLASISSIEKLFDLYFLFADAVSFVPVEFGSNLPLCLPTGNFHQHSQRFVYSPGIRKSSLNV